MFIKTSHVGLATLLAAFCAASFADDCAPAKGAMLDSGHTPRSATTTVTSSQEKPVVIHQVQTLTNKYVQTKDGKWYALGIAIKDLEDNTVGLTNCSRSSGETLGGESTTIYHVSMDSAGTAMDQRIWVTSKNLIVKAAGTVNGTQFVTTFDYANVTPPANATPMGGK